MTDAGPRFWPGGIPYTGRAVLPGVNDQPRPAPYGMTPGVRHVLPEQVNLDAAPVQPDNVQLDEEPPPGGAPAEPAPGAQTHRLKSIRVLDDKGNVVADMPTNPDTGNDYLKFQVQQIGDSLTRQAVTDADRQSAARAMQYGMSLVGLMPIKDIQAAIVHRYDTDERNDISRSVQEAKNKRAALMGKGGPVGPSKQDKFDASIDLDAEKTAQGIINNSETQAKVASLTDYEATLDKLEALISSPDALSQRSAIAEYLKELTGKQSTDNERKQITGAAGMLAKIESDLNLWSPTDASLSPAYIQEFKNNVATLKQAVRRRRQKLGEDVSNSLAHDPYLKKRGVGSEYGAYGRERVTGEAAPDPQEDDQKYLK